jgi:hypothetical protein
VSEGEHGRGSGLVQHCSLISRREEVSTDEGERGGQVFRASHEGDL